MAKIEESQVEVEEPQPIKKIHLEKTSDHARGQSEVRSQRLQTKAEKSPEKQPAIVP